MTSHDGDDDCKCPNDPKWLTLAVVVLPAVLPVIFEKIADALIARWGKDDHDDVEESSVKNKDKSHVE